jgi:hypothetical protein
METTVVEIDDNDSVTSTEKIFLAAGKPFNNKLDAADYLQDKGE